MAKSKKPKVKHVINTSKKPKALSSKKETVSFCWSYQKFDAQGPFEENSQKVSLEEIFGKQGELENFNYSSLGRRGSHFVSVDKITKDAQKRLVELNLDDYTDLFSLRFTGKQRLWCLKLDSHRLGVLWWDPNHLICPARKKHT